MPNYCVPAERVQLGDWENILIKILLAHEHDESILSNNILPAAFLDWSISKGCKLNMSETIADGKHSGWIIITPTCVKRDLWISIGDTVRFKHPRNGFNLDMNVVEDTEFLAGVETPLTIIKNGIQEVEMNFEWVLKADLILISQAGPIFRNPGE